MNSINYHKVDNMEFMRSIPDNFYDLAVADPEQGKKMHGGKFGSGVVPRTEFSKKDWDNQPATREYFNELFRISKYQIIWGEQYYYKNFGQGRIVWDKLNGASHQYDCEIAYCSLTERAEIFRYMWNGMMQGKSLSEGHVQKGNKSLNEKKIHPTQKPTALYAWQLKHFNIPIDWKIFDPNLGSGSHGIACLKLGYSLDACEKDTEYFDSATQWLEEEKEKINTGLFVS